MLLIIKPVKAFSLVLMMSVILYQNCLALLHANIITNFFKFKFITVGVIFGCTTKLEQINLLKTLQNHNLRVSYFNIDNNRCNLTAEEIILNKKYAHLIIILDAECENAEFLLQTSGKRGYFSDNYHWLALGISQNITEKFRKIELNINCELTVAALQNNSTNWEIFDVYNPAYSKGGQLHVTFLGFYNNQRGFQMKQLKNKYYNRKNMSEITLKSAMVIPENITMPFEDYMEMETDRQNNTYNRFQSVIMKNCRDMFNFTINYTVVNSWGYLLPNGEVDGMVKALKDKLVDFGSASLLFKSYRLKVLDYGYGTFRFRSAFFFRHPKTTATSSELYLRPLVNSVWLIIIATLILIAFILRLIIKKEFELLESHRNSSDDVSWSFLILYSVGEICQQGFSYIPSISSGRIVILTVLMFSFLIYQFYSASVVSILLMQPPRTINTLKDLLESPLKAGCQDSLYDRNYFSSTTNPLAISLYNSKIKAGTNNTTNFYPAEEGLKKVALGGFAFHSQLEIAYIIIQKMFSEKAICDLTEVEMYRAQYWYTAIMKGSPFKEMLNYCLAHQNEVGVMDRLRKQWKAPKYQCFQPEKHLEISVGLKESYWSLVLLGIGVIASLLVLMGEHLVWSRKLKRKNCKGRQGFVIEPFVN